MADLMSMYLENDNFDTVKCESAEKAIEQLSNGYNPALVLLDINLPGMSGFDFLKEFREKNSTVTPVIIVSARDADEDIIEGLGLGADEFVTKPFSPKVLVARVKAKLSRLSATEASVEETISFGPYTIFLNSCILKRRKEKSSFQQRNMKFWNSWPETRGKKCHQTRFTQEYGKTTLETLVQSPFTSRDSEKKLRKILHHQNTFAPYLEWAINLKPTDSKSK